MMGSEYYLHVTCNEQDVVLRIPTADLPMELRGGIAYGTKMNFTFRLTPSISLTKRQKRIWSNMISGSCVCSLFP